MSGELKCNEFLKTLLFEGEAKYKDNNIVIKRETLIVERKLAVGNISQQ